MRKYERVLRVKTRKFWRYGGETTDYYLFKSDETFNKALGYPITKKRADAK